MGVMENNKEAEKNYVKDFDDEFKNVMEQDNSELIVQDGVFETILERDAYDWLSSNETEHEYRVELLKYTKGINGRRKKVTCFQWDSEVPSKHEIGTMFGGGKYVLFITAKKQYLEDGKPKTKCLGRTYEFNLSEYYDKMINSEKTEKPNNSLSESIGIIEKIVTLFLPFVNAQNKSPSQEMVQMYSAMNQIMKRQAMDNLEFMKTIQNTTDDSIDTEEGSGVDYTKIIQPLIEKFLPLILGGNKTVINQIKKNETFKNVTSNGKQLDSVKKSIVRLVGDEKSKKIFSVLGM